MVAARMAMAMAMAMVMTAPMAKVTGRMAGCIRPIAFDSPQNKNKNTTKTTTTRHDKT